MKLVTAWRAGQTQLMLAVNGGFIDADVAARALGEPAAGGLGDVRAALERDGALDALRAIVEWLPESDLEPLDAATVTLAPPVVAPSKLLSVGVNYVLHAVESGMPLPDRPVLFAKLPNALVGDGAEVRKHAIADELDYEGELAFVIGRRASRVSRADALDHVAGYTIMNDVSARELQRAEAQWIRAKSLDTFAPVGPALVTVDDVPDPAQLRIRTLVNGELRQDESCGELLFGVPELVEFISQAITLLPGDVIATGTPAGVGRAFDPPRYLEPGDRVEITIDPIGTLHSTVA